MKQNISSSQLQELSLIDRKLLRNWWKPRSGDLWLDTATRGDEIYHANAKASRGNNTDLPTALPLLSIGQMIEFLGVILLHNDGTSWVVINDRRIYLPPAGGTHLCDSLWEAMKGELRLIQTKMTHN